MGGFFSEKNSQRTWWVLGGKGHISEDTYFPPMTVSPWSFSLSDLSSLCLQEFIHFSSGFLTPATVPTEVSAAHGFWSGKLWFSVFTRLPPILRAAICPLSSLTNLRRVGFSVWLAFYLWRWSGNSQASTMSWKLELSHELLWIKALSSEGGRRHSIYSLYL